MMLLAGAGYLYVAAPKSTARAAMIVGLLIAYDVFMKPKPPPTGDVLIGDAELRSDPGQWAQWPEEAEES